MKTAKKKLSHSYEKCLEEFGKHDYKYDVKMTGFWNVKFGQMYRNKCSRCGALEYYWRKEDE